MMRSKSASPSNGKSPPAEVVDLVNRCISCDELISEEFGSRPSVYLSKKTRFTESKMLVRVHETCTERGAGLATEQGYELKAEVSR
jgi:hypothetical protein